MPFKRTSHGFTLIELMIVVAIIAILAAIAYPSYQDSVRKSRRADAKAVLLEGAQFMERFYTENNRYDQDRASTPNPVALPANLQKSPKEGTTKYYDISLNTSCTGASTVTANAFTLSACPIAGSAQASDKCSTLTLANTGAKGTSSTATDCW